MAERPESFPDVLESFQDVLKSFPDVLKSFPDVLKSFPDVLKSFPDVLKSFPEPAFGIRKKLPVKKFATGDTCGLKPSGGVFIFISFHNRGIK
jgi:hypothetical protein